MNIDKYEMLTEEDLYNIYKKTFNSSDYSDFRWKLFKQIKDGEITKVGIKKYVVGYKPYNYSFESELAKSIEKYLQEEYPDVDVVVWETRILNEWMNLQISRNTIIVESEGVFTDYIFEGIRNTFENSKCLLMPKVEKYLRYAENDTVVVKKMVSRSPKSKNDRHIILEKLIVDLAFDKFVSALFDRASVIDVIGEICRSYIVDDDLILRYAKRRHKETEMMKILETADD